MTIGRIFEFNEYRPRRNGAARMECDMGNRYICDVLYEMRTCNETRNYGSLLGLIEECQTLANRMEAALSDKHNVLSYEQRRPVLKDEITELEWKKEELEEQVRKLEFEIKKMKRENSIKESASDS